MVHIKNVYLALKDQMPLFRLLRNLRKGHLIGLLDKRSHENANGVPKVMYNTKASAIKAAESMQRKTGNYFSNYKCLRCSGYHIGKNSENKTSK